MTASREHRYALPTGHRLGEYRIDRYLGSGGFDITYLTTDENLSFQVAIKEYLPSDYAVRERNHAVEVKSAADREDFEWGRERFLDEARSLARFDHPNIVGVQRFLEAHGTSYIVMDYVEGEPLSELLERKGTLTEAEIRRSVLPIADGLAEVHRVGLLHRDIKPSNIIIRKSGAPVLIDFGSARQATGMRSRSVTSVVTPGYAPPEQYGTKSNQGPATDIYAFGAVLYRCATGGRPDDATDRLLDDDQMPAAQSASSDYSEGLLAAIDLALALRLQDRPSSIAELIEELGYRNLHTTGVAIPSSGNCKTTAKEHARQGVGQKRSEATELHELGLDKLALPQLQHLAQQGDCDAQFSLGEMYASGQGVTENHPRAARWFQKAAKQGHTEAKYRCGKLHLRDEGVPMDELRAEHFFWEAAHEGHAGAQRELGLMFLRSKYGGPTSEVQGRAWLRAAANRGDQEARKVVAEEDVWELPDSIAELVENFTLYIEFCIEIGDEATPGYIPGGPI